MCVQRAGVCPTPPFDSTGRVVGILQRNWRDYVVTFPPRDGTQSQSRSSKHVLTVPWDRRIPKIRISTQRAEALQVRPGPSAGTQQKQQALIHLDPSGSPFLPPQDHRVLVRIDSWESSSQYPNGHTVRVLGRAGELETEIQTILIENAIHLAPFSDAQVRRAVSQRRAPLPVSAVFRTSSSSFPSSERCPSTPPRGRGGWTAPRRRRGETSGRPTWCSASTRVAARTWTTRCPCAGWTGACWSWASTSPTSPTLSRRGRSPTWKLVYGGGAFDRRSACLALLPVSLFFLSHSGPPPTTWQTAATTCYRLS